MIRKRDCAYCILIVFFTFVGVRQHADAQGTKADYERSAKLRERCENTVFKTKVNPNWFDVNTKFWYRNDLADGMREFVLVLAEKGVRQPAFDHNRLADALSKAIGKPQSPDKLPFDKIELDDDCKAVWFKAAGKHWRCELRDYQLEETSRPFELTAESVASRPKDNPWHAFSRDHNIFLRDRKTGEQWQLTKDGTPENSYTRHIRWSPDFKRFVVMRREKGDDRKVYIIESSPKNQLQPKLHSYDYLKPGDKLTISRPHLFDPEKREEIPIDDALISQPFEIKDVHWHSDSTQFTFLYNQRGHQVVRIISVDGKTGEASVLIDEKSDTFVDYAHKIFKHFIDKTNEVIWMSERDGWNHLYLIDSKTGEVINQITRGEWVVRQWDRKKDRVDREKRQIYFRAGGIYPSQDPYYVHYCRINFDGTGLVKLTAGDGTHSIKYSPDGKYIIDTYSRVDMPPVTELRSASDGALVCELEHADWSRLLETGWAIPERFVAKGRDGKTDIYGAIWRPTNLDEKKKYPVIERIYAGPHWYYTLKEFRTVVKAQELAELGFIVVQLDGMGTSWRSKKFHDVCWKNIADSGFPDRIPWIKAATKKYPYMDITCVGIFGGSAGGQSSTRALIAHGDFYKVAVSDCGCHDNRVDKIWWNEAWMGWPIGPHYEEQSNVTQAHRLQGKLLLTVGELDRNVDPASTMQLVNALIKADKDFDLIVFPGEGHGIGESKYGLRRRRDYFVRHLLGVEPRSE
jgi:hypothetical protein